MGRITKPKNLDIVANIMTNEKACVLCENKGKCGKCKQLDLLVSKQDIVSAYNVVLSILTEMMNETTTRILPNCHCAVCGEYVAFNEQITNFCSACGRRVER